MPSTPQTSVISGNVGRLVCLVGSGTIFSFRWVVQSLATLGRYSIFCSSWLSQERGTERVGRISPGGSSTVVCWLFIMSIRLLEVRLSGSLDSAVTSNPIYRIASVALTFATVAVACIIFRAQDLPGAWLLLSKMLRLKALWSELIAAMAKEPGTVVSITVLLLCCFSGPLMVKIYKRCFVDLPLELKLSAATCACVLCWVLSGAGAHPFIYFQF